MRYTGFIIALILSGLLTSVSAVNTIEDVKQLFYDKQYESAFMAADTLRAASPADVQTNLWYGKTAFAIGQSDSLSVAALTTAAKKGATDAYPLLWDYYLGKYDLTNARDILRQWRAALPKGTSDLPPELKNVDDRLTRMSNQLTRVEKIPVFAQYSISREQFDDALSKIGKVDTPKGPIYIGDSPFFINNTNRELFWTEPDEDGINRLFSAGVLDDGTRDEPVNLTQYVGEGDIIAPYLTDDGETLYFAARKDDGIGGYDIYMTRRNSDGGFYQPSNIGMPYNSSRDELMFVLDEMANVGWWITNRSTSPDSLTVYVFVPNAMRDNIPADHADLLQFAALTDISVTLPDGFDADVANNRVPRPARDNRKANADRRGADFELSLSNGQVLTSFSQFKNSDARTAMKDVISLRKEVNDISRRLQALRLEYAGGNKTLVEQIRTAEKELMAKQTDLRNLTNRVIRLETSSK